jgi:hypothetical protein
MMRNEYPQEDLALLTRLAAVFGRVDGVPADVRLAAERAGARIPRPERLLEPVRALAFRTADGEPLVYGDGTVRIEVSTGFGWLTGVVDADVPEVTVRWAEGTWKVAVDEVGRFSADGLPGGPVCVSVRLGDETVSTPWFVP